MASSSPHTPKLRSCSDCPLLLCWAAGLRPQNTGTGSGIPVLRRMLLASHRPHKSIVEAAAEQEVALLEAEQVAVSSVRAEESVNEVCGTD